jgi:hypothetical protein
MFIIVIIFKLRKQTVPIFACIPMYSYGAEFIQKRLKDKLTKEVLLYYYVFEWPSVLFR